MSSFEDADRERRQANFLRVVLWSAWVDGGLALCLLLLGRPAQDVMATVAFTLGNVGFWALVRRVGVDPLGVIFSVTCAVGVAATVSVVGNPGIASLFVGANALLAAAILTERQFLIASLANLAAAGMLGLFDFPPDTLASTTFATSVVSVAVVALASAIALMQMRSSRQLVTRALDEAAAARTADSRRMHAERTFERIAEFGSDLVLIARLDGSLDFVGRSCARLLGVARVGEPSSLEHLVVPDDRTALSEVWQRVVREGHAKHSFTVARVAGAPLLMDFRFQRAEIDGADEVIVTAQDATERVRLTEGLQRAQKLEVLGRLASSVAHDMNNVLAVVSTCASLAKDATPQASQIHQDLDDILTASSSGARLMRDLLAFSKRQVVSTASAPVAASLEALRGLVARSVGTQIEVRFEVDPGLPPVGVSVSQLEQLVMNMAVNARDAMSKGGVFTVSARPRTGAASDAGAETGGVEVVLSDTGEGIPEHVRSRIFEPFFTTKPVGVGTGLGLATCVSIVEQAHGRISVESRAGVGTSFRIWLPAALEGDVASEARATPGRGRVLVVDDDDGVRKIAARVLRDRGFEVREASGAVSALEMVRTDGPFDAAVVDLYLGADDGVEVARSLLGTAQLGLVLMSGYVTRPDAATELLRQGAEFVQKPFGPEQLFKAVEASLARRMDRVA